MEFLPIRLSPGADLRRALEEAVRAQGLGSAFVVAGIGSLSDAETKETKVAGPLEMVSLSGSLCPSGAHLHMSVSDASGNVYGGHVGHGNTVRTTAEVLIATLSDWSLTREHDATTGFSELVVRCRV
jgi:predicted DNA-binding protein with PD1-like motif